MDSLQNLQFLKNICLEKKCTYFTYFYSNLDFSILCGTINFLKNTYNNTYMKEVKLIFLIIQTQIYTSKHVLNKFFRPKDWGLPPLTNPHLTQLQVHQDPGDFALAFLRRGWPQGTSGTQRRGRWWVAWIGHRSSWGISLLRRGYTHCNNGVHYATENKYSSPP